MNLVKVVKAYKKVLYKYRNNKKKGRESVFSLLNGAGDLLTNGMEKAKVLNACFASVFTGKTCIQEYQNISIPYLPQIRGKD